VRAQVYESDMPLLEEGQQADVSADHFPRRTPFAGRVRKIAATESGSHVLVEIDDAEHELRPGMPVLVRIKVPPRRLSWLQRALRDEWRDRLAVAMTTQPLAGASAVGLQPLLECACTQAALERGLVLSVLESAVIDPGLRTVVYREAGPGLFEAVEVAVGPRCGDYRPILRGLRPGQRVAAAGAFLLDAETRLNPALAAAYFGAARNPPPARPPSSDMARALAALSAADRGLAERQKTCPVTGEALGSMGTPFRVEIGGKVVLLCCEHCTKELRQHPAKYLAKVP
jgi:hypothetical protein